MVPDDEDNIEENTAVKVLIATLDYQGTGMDLSCSQDGQNFQNLCYMCGVRDVTYMRDTQVTPRALEDALVQGLQSCKAGEMFIFFFAGHGTTTTDMGGDEADGEDEVMVLMDETGKVNMMDFDTSHRYYGQDGIIANKGLMTDDLFAKLVTETCPEGVKMLIITDCCHSGTIADMEKSMWDGMEALSIAGANDDQTAGDTGAGGIMTHSLFYAIEQLSQDGITNYSVAKVFNTMVTEREAEMGQYKSGQDFILCKAGGYAPDRMPWPLIPAGQYVAPLRRNK